MHVLTENSVIAAAAFFHLHCCSSLGENPVHIRSANDQQFCTVQSNTQRPIQTFIKFNSIWPLTVIIVRALLFFCPHVWHTAVFLNNHIPHPHWVGLLRQKNGRTNARLCVHTTLKPVLRKNGGRVFRHTVNFRHSGMARALTHI